MVRLCLVRIEREFGKNIWKKQWIRRMYGIKTLKLV